MVWEAGDRTLGRKVAFKAVRAGPSASAHEERVLREAEVAARLSHPNIVTLYDVGRSEHGPYLVLELLEGRTLAQRLEDGPGLGRLDEANSEANLARDSVVTERGRAAVVLYEAESAVALGRVDDALKALTVALSLPVGLTSPAALRVDPRFASLRGDPRFEALLARGPR